MIYKRFPDDVRYDRMVAAGLVEDFIPIWDMPIKTTMKCGYCGSTKRPEMFPLLPIGGIGVFDQSNNIRSPYCEICLQRIVDKFSKELNDEHYGLFRLCALLNVYYSENITTKLYEEDDYYEDGTRVSSNIPKAILYLRYIMNHPDFQNRTFFDTSCCSFKEICSMQTSSKDELCLTEEDRRNRLQIITVFHRDVFENEPIEERKILMADLVTMCDDSMTDDFVRQQAAIEIVRTFRRISKISEALQNLQKTPEDTANNAKVIKELVDQKKKETDMVTSFSKDHGFAEKYALAKSKGSGTLGAIVRDMNEKGYDRGAVNEFDIETSKAMKQVSDISAESIFKQINLNESDYAEMVKEQAIEIRRMRDLMERQAEELRVLREKHLKQELIEEYRQDLLEKDIDEDEVEALIEEEIHHKTKFDYDAGV